MSVTNRKLFNRGARDELRKKGGIMASSEPMMQAAGYENGGQITREDILRFLAQGPVGRNPDGARFTIDSVLYPDRRSGQKNDGYTYNRAPSIDSPMTVTTVGPRGVMSQASPRKYYQGLVRGGLQEPKNPDYDAIDSIGYGTNPGEVGSLAKAFAKPDGRIPNPISYRVADSSAHANLFGKEGSAARYLAQKAAAFLDSDTSIPREQIYGENPQVTGSDTAFETISQVSEPPSYLYVNIPSVTINPVLMTERDFQRFEKMYPDAARSSESTVIDVAALDSRVDISNIPIVTSLDSTSGSRKDAVEKTKKTTTQINAENPVRTTGGRSELEFLDENNTESKSINTASENTNSSTGSTLSGNNFSNNPTEGFSYPTDVIPEDPSMEAKNVFKTQTENLSGVLPEEIYGGYEDSEAIANREKRLRKLTSRPDAIGEGTSAPDKPKFPTLDQFIKVQGGKDKREKVQTNADEILDDATKDFKEVKTDDAFDDVFDKYVSRFSEILGDNEEEKKKNTGFALAMYGATFAATGDAGQAAQIMIETLRGDAATRQKRTDQIKMLALQAATDKETADAALQLQLNKEIRQDERELKKYEAKLEIKEKFADPTGYLDTDAGKFFSEIYADVLTDDTLNEDEKGEAFITRAGEANAEAFYRALGIPRLGVKQGGGKGTDWFNSGKNK